MTWFLRQVSEQLDRTFGPLSCRCFSSSRSPVFVCPLCFVCFLLLCCSVACSGSFRLFSAPPLASVVMCLSPSLLAWGYLFCDRFSTFSGVVLAFSLVTPSSATRLCILCIFALCIPWMVRWAGLMWRLKLGFVSMFSFSTRCRGIKPCTSYSRTNDYVKLRINGYDTAYTFTQNNITLEHNAINNKNTIAHTDAHNTQF